LAITQGDATLEGAVYGLYNNGVLVDTYTTDANGYFLTDYYVCGDNWYLQEITPSEGYLLDDKPSQIVLRSYHYHLIKLEFVYRFSEIHFFDQANNVWDIKLKSTVPPFFKFKKVSTIPRSSEDTTWSNSF